MKVELEDVILKVGPDTCILTAVDPSMMLLLPSSEDTEIWRVLGCTDTWVIYLKFTQYWLFLMSYWVVLMMS